MKITITAAPTVANITGLSSVCTGSNIQLSDATSGGIWNTSNGQVATVSTSGLVHGVSGGSVTISYTVNGGACGMIVRTHTVTVNASATVDAITGTATLCVGSTTQLSDGISGGVWSSSNTSIASISTSGLVTGKVGGSVTITYTVTTGCSVASATRTVTVSSSSSVAAISGNSAVCLGNNIQLTDATAGGIWNTSNGNIATVSTSGVVRGIRAGTVTITYTISGACGMNSTTKSVTVNTAAVVAAITGSSTLCVRTTTTLEESTTGGTWSSTNSAVATVNNSGVVTGVKLGNATINYTVVNACGISTASKSISVDCTVPTLKGAADVTDSGAVTSKEETLDVTFDAQVAPNPSQTDFMLTVHSSNTTRAAYVRIFDMSGRLIEEKRGAIGEPIRFGGMYLTGMYIVQVMQGDNLKVVKVIKD
jgi:trimeric autotransporter adhesin